MCGEEIIQKNKGRPRKWCSDGCRIKAHNSLQFNVKSSTQNRLAMLVRQKQSIDLQMATIKTLEEFNKKLDRVIKLMEFWDYVPEGAEDFAIGVDVNNTGCVAEDVLTPNNKGENK